ncbi:MAG: hypothetical protein JW774_11650 [Candidatus Aureabacteria bacterium]|nr:hypothetical protein [Candidatus Auribacterota bacterium]
MFVLKDSAQKMAEKIQRIIDKGELCKHDFPALLHEADKDGILDFHEKNLLKALADLMSNKMIRRVSSCSECDMLNQKSR